MVRNLGVVLCLLIGVAACGDDGATPDASVPADAAPDARPIDAAPDAPPDAPAVVPTTLTIDMPTVTLPDGATRMLMANLAFSDSTSQNVTSSATWMSTDTAVVTVAGGLVTAVAPGTAMVTATSMGKTGSSMITVTAAAVTSLTVGPDNQMLCAGQTQQLTATAMYTDGSSAAVTAAWTITPTATATITAAGGLVTGVAQGTATATATYVDPISTTTFMDTGTVIVNAACLVSIAITGGTTVVDGLTISLTATGTFSDTNTMDISEMVTWETAAAATATVSNAATFRGDVTGVAPGTVTITARSGAINDTHDVTVTPAENVSISMTPATATILNTATQQLTVLATTTDGSMPDITATATYGAAPAGIVTISAGGLVTPVANATGTVTVTATVGMFMDTSMITVTAPATPNIAVSSTNGPLTAGGTDAGGSHTFGVPFTRTFTITNTGTAALTVNVTFPSSAAPSNCTQTLSDPPDPSVAPGGMTTFDIDTTITAAGAANCPFQVNSNDPDTAAFRIDVTATGTPATPTVKKSATVTCGITSGFGIIVGTLSDFTSDGSVTTTNTTLGNCTETLQVGTLPGGTNVVNAADSAVCGALSCTQAGTMCSNFGGAPFTAGAAFTTSITDTLLGGTATQPFTTAPGTLTRSSVGGAQSRSAPLTMTTTGGVANTLTLVTIQQQLPAAGGQRTVICEFAANSASVTIPPSILGRFNDGAFDLLVDTRVQAFQVVNGYDIAFVGVNSTMPQQSSFTP